MGESREISVVMEERQWKGSTHEGKTCPTLPVEVREGERGGGEGREGGRVGGGETREGGREGGRAG